MAAMGSKGAAAACVLAAAAVAGCGTSARRAEVPAAPPLPVASRDVAVPEGYRLHSSAEAGVSLALPRGWQALAGRDARYPGVIQTLTHLHRAFLPYLVSLATPDSPLKLFAFDPASSHRHPSIASVQAVSSGRPGAYERWSRRTLQSLEGLRNKRGPLRSARVDVPAGPALRVEFTRSDGDRVVVYVVATHGGLWAVTFASLPGAPDRLDFDRAAATLRIAAPRGGPQVSGGLDLPVT